MFRNIQPSNRFPEPNNNDANSRSNNRPWIPTPIDHHHQHRRVTLTWNPRMESDVEEGEIRESECLTPLSVGEEDSECQLVHKRRRVVRSDDRRWPTLSRHVEARHHRRRSPAHEVRRGSEGIGKSYKSVSSNANRSRDTHNSKNNHRKRYDSSENSGRPRKRLSLEASVPSSSSNINGAVKSSNPNHKKTGTRTIQLGITNGDVNSTQTRNEIQENYRVIVFCDPPRSPDDATEVGSRTLETISPPMENDDNEVEVLSVVDKSSRVTELIVIDSTSSSESDEETDFEDPDPDPDRTCVPLSPITKSTYFVRPKSPPAWKNSTSDSASDVTTLVEREPEVNLNIATANVNSSPVDVAPVIVQPLYKIVPEIPNQTIDQSVKITSEGEEEDLEELELRIKALEGLMNTLPSSESAEDTQSKQESSLLQSNTHTIHDGANIQSIAELPDDNEKENENDLELQLLRSKLLSDLAKQKTKRDAAVLPTVSTKIVNNEKQPGKANPRPSNASKARPERRNSKSSSTKTSRIKKSSESACRNKTSVSSGSHNRKSSTNSITTKSFASSTLSMPTISVSVSNDGKHRTVFSSETLLETASVVPILIQSPSPSNPQRIVRVLDPIPKPSSPIPSNSPLSKPKKSKISSPQKRKQQSMSSSGPQKVLTKPNSSSNSSVSGKITPLSHKSAVVKHVPSSKFSVPRSSNTFKSKYNSSKNSRHSKINRPSKRVQPIVIQLRNNDESTDEEENEGGEEENAEEEEQVSNTTILPKEFHSSLDKFLKSVRESATKNGVTGNPFQRNTTNQLVDNSAHSTAVSEEGNDTNGHPGEVVIQIPVNQDQNIFQTPDLMNNSPSTSSSGADVETVATPVSNVSSTDAQGDVRNNELLHLPLEDNTGVITPTIESMSPSLEHQIHVTSSPKAISPQSSPVINVKTTKSSSVHQRVPSPSEPSFMEQVDAALRSKETVVKPKTALIAPSNLGRTSRNVLKPQRKDIKNNATGESLADQFTRTREELQLREKLLRITFKKSETKINLTRAEQEFLTSRKMATNLLGTAIDKINQQAEKKLQCTRIEQQVDKLKKQLEVAQRSLYVKNIESDALHEDAVSTISKAFDMRAKSVTFGIQCKKLGSELNGDQYKIPSTGAGDMLGKIKDIYKLATNDELKKGSINFKTLEEQIITSLQSRKKLETSTISTPISSSHMRGSSGMIQKKNLQPERMMGGLTRHVMEPDRVVKTVKSRLPCLMISKSSVEVEISKFTVFESCLIPSTVLSNFDCNAVVCPHIASNSCNSENCKFQHLPDLRNKRKDVIRRDVKVVCALRRYRSACLPYELGNVLKKAN